MASQCVNKRRYQRRPGVMAAALELGITYSHFRRVLTGERRSQKILRKLRTMKGAGGASNNHPHGESIRVRNAQYA